MKASIGRQTAAQRQLEFCFAAPAHCPSASDLRERAAELLRMVNAMELATKVRVEWNPKMRTAVGRADTDRQLVTLNPALAQFGEVEIDRTLRHELAHLLAYSRVRRRRIAPHGLEWQRACRDLGLCDEKAFHRLPLPTRFIRRRYLYQCPHCARKIPRVRRLRRTSACLACCRRYGDGTFEARFKLKLIKR